MSRIRSVAGEFARRGFDSPSAAAAVWQRWQERTGREPGLPLDALEPAANRDQTLESLARVAERAPELMEELLGDPDWLRRVVLVLGASDVLARFLAKHPDEIHTLAADTQPRSAEGWARFFSDRVPRTDDGVATADADQLRRAYHAALCQITARDLAAVDPVAVVDAVAGELTHVADAVLEAGLALARAEVDDWDKVRLAVVAMGKTGAGELNYVSDVDVIHIAEPANGATPEEAMQIGTKLAGALARVCSAHTAEGTIWPIDAALRPEGKAGPLVRTVASCRAYYEKWAANWEFQALLKARPAAGDRQLGQQFCDMVSPLIWEAGRREGFLPELRAMRQRVISLIPPKQVDRDIKLSSGGLRDTEFSAQLLQLVHGRGDERIRARGTFDGLEALVLTGYIGRADGAELEAAYRFQRVLEHRAQLRHLRRTHLLPDEPTALTHLARSLRNTPEEVESRWRASRRTVERLHQRIFFSPLLDAVSAVSADTLRLTPEAAEDRMRALGFIDPRSALGHIQAITQGTSRRAEIQRQLMPAMLGWFAEGPNPDFGLLAFRQLSDALGTSSWYLRALRDEGFMAQRLARIAASSRYVVDLLRRAPEMIQMLASQEELQLRSAEALADAMARAVDRNPDDAGAVASVRALRRAELCRIALADVLGNVGLEAASSALSDLASASVDAALRIAARTVDAPQVGVVALGRWGGREMSYSSDADALFVVADDVEGDGLAAATTLVRRVSEILGQPGPDPALVVDTDLRPEGKGGPQVRTLSSYLAYYDRWASTWEAQAMLRARAAAGQRALADELLARLSPLRYPVGGLTHAQVVEIRRLKSRMETERIPRGVPKERHLKLGQGGLSDVEWTIQLLQLQHADELPALRTPSTLGALAAAEDAELLTRRQASDLRTAWEHVSRLRNAIMLARGRATDALPHDYRELATVAELLGYSHAQSSQLVEDTRRMMRRAYQVVDQVFWGS